jgi:FixJ family two-component response regulator
MKPESSEKFSDPVVLVVDDDQGVREGIKTLLDSVGLQSKTYASAVDCFASDFFDNKLSDQASCLVLDIRLPGLSGFDFQTELANRHINIPIVFITGHGDIRMCVKAIKDGAVDFLTKPFRGEDLIDAVRAGLDGDRNRREYEHKVSALGCRYNALTDREQDVMTFVIARLMNKQVAEAVGIAEVTVKVHRHKLMKKLGAKNLADLVRMASILGLPHAAREWQINDHHNSRHTRATFLPKS